MSYNDDLIKHQKSHPTPGVGQYKVQEMQKKYNMVRPKQTSDKNERLNDIERHSSEVPGFIYNVDKGYTQTLPKSLSTKIMPAVNLPQKITGKGPGYYEYINSFRQTQEFNPKFNPIVARSPRKTYLDTEIKLRKNQVGPGTYRNVERAHTRLSPPPASIKMKRH